MIIVIHSQCATFLFCNCESPMSHPSLTVEYRQPLYPRASKADNTCYLEQRAFSSGSNASCPQDGCQVIVAPVIKREEVG